VDTDSEVRPEKAGRGDTETGYGLGLLPLMFPMQAIGVPYVCGWLRHGEVARGKEA
jgi:hypothetical protein